MQESQREGEKGIWEVVPFVVMVVMEGCTIALTIFAKTVMTKKGMSPFVFVVYMHALSSLILLPYSFIFHYKDRITISQNLAFLGLSYSSPIVVCAMGLLIPSLSFILSIILRKTKLDWRNSSFRAKVTGTIISFMGATMVELYKGPLIRKSKLSSSSHPSYPTINKFLIYSSKPEYWVLGGILLATSSLSVSVWNNVQVGTVKQYPQVMKLVSFYSLFGTIQSAMLCLFLERNPDAWKLKVDTELLLIGLSAVFAGLIRSHVHMWCMQLKGPFYVPIFKPFGIVFATIFGVILSAVHYGSVIGAIIIGTGYFGVMYGQLKEEELEAQQDDKVKIMESCEDEKVPLLQEENIV
ncbi:WAT1-related protein At1g70260 isoform X2 [Ziziphus jujuba]|uniref:WAT1-related protein At1g70260 isoform X2 n=1 Tax=Ziziphus jujuba TaxID=326968 RepID=A0ABM3I2N2_ZIZJJ|nr:WAT1-related protein At1g70260 isoform X2 [Ziziphus jujuba]